MIAMFNKKKKYESALQNRKTMEELYAAYEQKMFVVAKSILGNDWQAEDAVHEAFIRLVKYLPKCQDIHSLKTKTLVTRIIKSASIDIYRKNKREVMNISVEENRWIEDNHNVIESYLSSLSAEEILTEINEKLPDIYKDVIRLRYYDGLPVSQISKILDISEDTVYQRLSRGKRMIKALIGDEMNVQERFE